MCSNVAAMGINSERKRWLAIGACVFVAHALVSVFVPAGFGLTCFADVTQTTLLFVLTAVAFGNVLRTRGNVRAFWVLMTAGFAAWFVAQFMWSYYEIVLERPVPEPFSGDIILFLHVVPMMAALVLRPHRSGEIRKLSLPSIDFVLLLFWWLFLYVFSVIPWQLFYDRGQYSVSFNLLYIAENVALMAGLGILSQHCSNECRRLYRNLFVGCALYLLSSQLINAAILTGKYHTGGLYDLSLVASMLWFIAVTVTAPSTRTASQADNKEATSHVDALVSRMAMVAIISIPAIAAWSYFYSGAPSQICRFRLATSLAAMVLMSLVLFAKQIVLDRERMRLLAESHESYARLKRLQTQLVQSEKLAALGQLVSGAAHEINNPLTAILGYADLIASDERNDPAVLAHATKIKQQAHRTKDLVLNLLRFARQSDSAKKLVDVNVVVNDTVQLRELEFKDTRVAIRRELANSIPPVWADQTQLLEVCFQLIVNALDAVRDRDHCSVAIRTSHKDGCAVIEVSDNGPGVADPARVFDPFYTTKRVGKGPGLGLSACYGIVKEHQGEILCENLPQGGARFSVRLPLAATVVIPATPKSANEPQTIIA